MPKYETLANDPLHTVTPQPKPQSWQADETLLVVCENLWEFLSDNAYSDEPNVLRWKGPISNWFRHNKKANLYSPIMYLMKEMGSCYIETVGTRWTDTVVRLVKPPTIEGLKAVRRDHFFYEKPGINKRDEREILVQAVDDLRKALVELTKRVDYLESREGFLK